MPKVVHDLAYRISFQQAVQQEAAKGIAQGLVDRDLGADHSRRTQRAKAMDKRQQGRRVELAGVTAVQHHQRCLFGPVRAQAVVQVRGHQRILVADDQPLPVRCIAAVAVEIDHRGLAMHLLQQIVRVVVHDRRRARADDLVNASAVRLGHPQAGAIDQRHPRIPAGGQARGDRRIRLGRAQWLLDDVAKTPKPGRADNVRICGVRTVRAALSPLQEPRADRIAARIVAKRAVIEHGPGERGVEA